jgi:PAS domain S-box-containing protein
VAQSALFTRQPFSSNYFVAQFKDMYTQLRKSGIEVLGDISWGSHFCQFYETKKDLLELLVPYFKAGLENNEYCLWVIANPMTIDDALQGLQKAVPDFQKYIQKQSIEILTHMDWFMTDKEFDGEQINAAWLKKLDQALEKGYDGLRINGNESWLRRHGWDNFMEYERGLNNVLKNRHIIGLCTYPLSVANGEMVLDVAHAHEAVVAKRRDRWEILETPALRMKKAELVEQNKQLDKLVAERTRELEKEIEERGKAEAKFKAIVEQSLVGFYIIHNEKFAYVNPQFAKIFGYTQDELIDSYAEVVIHPGDRERFRENLRIQMEGEKETLHYEATGLMKTGETIWIEVFCHGTLGEKTKAIMGTILDITKRKKAEIQLMYEKDLSSSIIESIPGIFELYDRQFRFLRWNKQFELVSGYTPEEIRNLHVVDDLTFGGEREKRYNILKRIYETGRDEGEVTITVKDGRKIPLYFVGHLINYEGEPCYICSAIDITERKRIEEDLKSSYEQIRSLSEHLTTVREEERKHIAREIHDELGQELTVLKMDVGSVVKKIPLTDEIMRKRLASFSGLIDNIVQSVRRIASELRPSLLDDLGLPAAIAWHLEEFEKRSGIRAYFTEPKDEWILPDNVKINLFRIVQEATTNIGRHSKATEVHVNLERNDHSIALWVFDNGVGFNVETICKGNTLGILGMRERASIVGGKLEIKTAPGNGTGIVVSVPLPL